jgi:hypothetical protein
MGFPADRASSIVAPASGKTSFATVSGTASAAKATSVGEGGRWISVMCTQTFNLTFSDDGTSTVTDPAAEYYFAANVVYSFELTKRNSHFKVKTSADGFCLYWLSSRS